MRTLVGIGGGELRELDTMLIDQEIVRLTGRRRPRALFIPTASGDSASYWEAFRRVYGGKLGCQTDVLWLIRQTPTVADIAAQILGNHLVYVGGGNTLKMMRVWRRLGVDSILLEAYDAGVVLAGLSAGSICCFRWGCSDSRKFTASGSWEYMRVRGLGIIRGTHCPHYQRKGRRQDFARMIGKHGGIGIALDDNCALICTDDRYTVLPARAHAGACRLHKCRGDVVTEIITGSGSISELCQARGAGRRG